MEGLFAHSTPVISDQVLAPCMNGVYSQDITAPNPIRYVIPAEWYGGRYVTFEAHSNNLWILFGDSTVTSTPTARNALDVDVLIPLDVVSWAINNGMSRDFVIPPSGKYLNADGTEISITHFSVVGVTAAGFWQARMSHIEQGFNKPL